MKRRSSECSLMELDLDKRELERSVGLGGGGNRSKMHSNTCVSSQTTICLFSGETNGILIKLWIDIESLDNICLKMKGKWKRIKSLKCLCVENFLLDFLLRWSFQRLKLKWNFDLVLDSRHCGNSRNVFCEKSSKIIFRGTKRKILDKKTFHGNKQLRKKLRWCEQCWWKFKFARFS